MSQHPKAGTPGTIRPQNDLVRNPGIGQSKGTTAAGLDPDTIAADNTVEGDVANDVDRTGAIRPDRIGRTNQ